MQSSKPNGFTLMELIIVMAILSGIALLSASTMLGFTHRFTSDLLLDRTERSANRLMAEFSSPMKSARTYAIYPDAVTWQASVPGTDGNFILITGTDGTQTGFAFAGSEVQIIRQPAGTRQILTLHRSAGIKAGGAFAFMDSGLPTLAWQVNLPSEQLHFRTSAQPLYMQ